MSKKIILSYSAINNYIISPHSWLNKQMGIEIATTPAMQSGKDAHKVIQDHCTGIKKDDRLKHFDWHFTKAEHHAMRPYNDDFTLHGYIDMIAYDSKVICEIKTGSVWSQKRFNDAMQWRYYLYVTQFKKALMVTCKFDLSEFKTYYFEATPQDMIMAQQWVDQAIRGISAGKFKDDLVDGKCVRDDCPYREACYFKN